MSLWMLYWSWKITKVSILPRDHTILKELLKGRFLLGEFKKLIYFHTGFSDNILKTYPLKFIPTYDKLPKLPYFEGNLLLMGAIRYFRSKIEGPIIFFYNGTGSGWNLLLANVYLVQWFALNSKHDKKIYQSKLY